MRVKTGLLKIPYNLRMCTRIFSALNRQGNENIRPVQEKKNNTDKNNNEVNNRVNKKATFSLMQCCNNKLKKIQ